MDSAAPQPSVPASRHERGRERLTRLNGSSRARVVDAVAELSTDMAGWIVDFGYGDCYDESALPARERQLMTVAALTSLGGCEAQLDVHLSVALNVGVSPGELSAAIGHCVPFCGFPRAINALGVLRAVLERRGVPLPLGE